MKLIFLFVLISLSFADDNGLTRVPLRCESVESGEFCCGSSLYYCTARNSLLVDSPDVIIDKIMDKNNSEIQETISIKGLKFDDCKDMKFIPQDLDEFFPDLEGLIVRNSALQSLEKDDIIRFKKLKYLDVSGNKLQYLDSAYNENLECLNIDANPLKYIGSILRNFKNLKTLTFTSCKDSEKHTDYKDFENFDSFNGCDDYPTKLKRQELRPASKVKTFDTPCSLMYFERCDAIVKCNSSIDNERAEMRTITGNLDNGNGWNCNLIFISGIYVKDALMKYLPKNFEFAVMTKLSIVSSGLVKIEKRYLSENLRLLELNGNILTNIKRNTFENLVELEELNLSHNKLKSFETDLIAPLKKLKKLDLSGNLIEKLTPDLMDNVSRMTMINLQENYCINAEYPSMSSIEIKKIIEDECQKK